uniref:hypothetical protein n=1 Tax=Thermococcus sp. TaxID=35749 RepID=UPI0025E797A5
MAMKRAPFVLFLTLLLVSPGLVYAGSYGTARRSDYGLYLYFNGLLGEFNSLIAGIPGGKNLTAEINFFCSVTNSTAEEVARYSPLGVSPKAVLLSVDFRFLGEGLEGFYVARESFLRDFARKDFVGAGEDLSLMRGALSEISRALGDVSGVSLVDGSGRPLHFDLRGVYGNLDVLRGLVSHYEALLRKSGVSRRFSIYLVGGGPFLYENVTFYGYAPNLTNVTVVIGNGSYAANVSNGSFSLVHVFKRVGTYVVYAVAMNGSLEVRSNVLNVSVGRIPTSIVVVQRGRSLEGRLLDYFGGGLSGRPVLVMVDGREYRVLSGEGGNFSVVLPQFSGVLNATVSFPGDGVYAPSNLTWVLLPPKRGLTLRLVFNKKRVRSGEVRIPGFVNGTSLEIPVEVYVDGRAVGRMEVRGNFTVTVKLGRGTHTVYVRFPGNGEFAESISNTLEIEVVPYSYLSRLLLLVVLVVVGFSVYRFLTRPRKGRRGKGAEPASRLGVVEAGEESLDVVGAYRVLYRLFRRLYNLPRSITPREL